MREWITFFKTNNNKKGHPITGQPFQTMMTLYFMKLCVSVASLVFITS